MPTRLSRAEQTEATEWRLLAAAYRVFLARGFHEATLDEVAEEAGLTKGAVYSRFDGKADLFLALLERRVAQRIQDVQGALAEHAPEEHPAEMGRRWAAVLRDDLDWMLLVIEFRLHAARHPELNRRYATIHAAHRRAHAAVIDAGMRALGRTLTVSSEDVARTLMTLATGIVLERASDSAAFPEAMIAHVNDALCRGLTAEPPAARPRPRRRTRR